MAAISRDHDASQHPWQPEHNLILDVPAEIVLCVTDFLQLGDVKSMRLVCHKLEENTSKTFRSRYNSLIHVQYSRSELLKLFRICQDSAGFANAVRGVQIASAYCAPVTTFKMDVDAEHGVPLDENTLYECGATAQEQSLGMVSSLHAVTLGAIFDKLANLASVWLSTRGVQTEARPQLAFTSWDTCGLVAVLAARGDDVPLASLSLTDVMKVKESSGIRAGGHRGFEQRVLPAWQLAGLRKLQKLALCIRDTGLPRPPYRDGYVDRAYAQQLGRFIEVTKTLSCLHLDVSESGILLHDLTLPSSMPSLVSLRLIGLGVAADSLIADLTKYADHLRCLSVSGCWMSETDGRVDGWRRVLTFIRDCMHLTDVGFKDNDMREGESVYNVRYSLEDRWDVQWCLVWSGEHDADLNDGCSSAWVYTSLSDNCGSFLPEVIEKEGVYGALNLFLDGMWLDCIDRPRY